MLDVTKLGNSIEEIDFVILIVLILVEIVIDVFKGNRRSYRDSIANIAIAIVYVFTSTAAVYLIAFTGLTFFSQFSLMQITTNSWTLILAIAIADFIYYWEHRVEHRIRFFWAYHSVHHSSTENIKTNNPIKINEIEYQRIAKYMIKSKSFKDIWMSIFGSPDRPNRRIKKY